MIRSPITSLMSVSPAALLLTHCFLPHGLLWNRCMKMLPPQSLCTCSPFLNFSPSRCPDAFSTYFRSLLNYHSLNEGFPDQSFGKLKNPHIHLHILSSFTPLFFTIKLIPIKHIVFLLSFLVPSSEISSSAVSFCLNFYFYFYVCSRLVVFLHLGKVIFNRGCPMGPSSTPPSCHSRDRNQLVPQIVLTCVCRPSSTAVGS